MNTVRMILCGNVEDSRMNPSEKVGVVSVVLFLQRRKKLRINLKNCKIKILKNFIWNTLLH